MSCDVMLCHVMSCCEVSVSLDVLYRVGSEPCWQFIIKAAAVELQDLRLDGAVLS